MSAWRVELGDSLDVMATLPDASVDAIVTSPPYPDQRTYASGETDPERTRKRPTHHSRRKRRQAVATYPDWLDPFMAQMQRVLTPTGSLILNLGVVVRDGEESDYADEVLRRARAGGWKLLHRMIWHKPNGGMLSDRRYLMLQHEWALWLARSTGAFRGYHGGYPDEPPDAHPGYDRHARLPHSETSTRRVEQPYLRTYGDERYQRRGKSKPLHPDGARPGTVVTCGVGEPVPPWLTHPARMPLDVATRYVRIASPVGGLVLDPFCGAGTTGLACRVADRRFLGVELREHYADQARRRIREFDPLLAELDQADAQLVLA